MLHRRNFIQKGVFFTTALAVPSILQAREAIQTTFSTDSSATPLSWHKIVVDRQFPESEKFTTEIQRYGIPVQQISTDPSQFWYKDLQPLLRSAKPKTNKPIAIGGLTSPGTAHCLELLAQREGAQLVYYVDHCCQINSNTVSHHTFHTSPIILKENLRLLNTENPEWIVTTATQMATLTIDQSIPTQNTTVTINTGNASWATWVIIPTHKQA